MLRLQLPRPARALASFVSGLLVCGGCLAGTGTVTAQATVDTFCTVSTTALAFGPYDPIVANRTSALDNGTAGTISVTCVKGTNPTIALGNGNNFVTATSTRRMQNASKPTVFLNYEMYQPPNSSAGAACTFPGTTIWNATNLLSPPSAPNKNSRTFNVCGTVPAGQDVEVGSYSDTVVVTVTF